MIEVSGSTLFHVPYYAIGHCALLRSAALLFGNTAYVRSLAAADFEHKAVLAWV